MLVITECFSRVSVFLHIPIVEFPVSQNATVGEQGKVSANRWWAENVMIYSDSAELLHIAI